MPTGGTVAADELGFDAEEFRRMSHSDKIRTCRRLAERARAIAETCDGKFRPAYLKIAAEWDKLADEMRAQRP